MTKYEFTKEFCKSKIKGVCSKCGGKLTPIETVDNLGNLTFWAGCKKCSTFCWGVDKKVFDTARRLVIDRKLIPYTHQEEPIKQNVKEYEYWLNSQTAGAVYIVYDVLNYYGVKNETR